MICATTECPIFYSCHQSADCCYYFCWCTACCFHNWFCFYSFTLQLAKCCYCHYCFHWLLPPLVVGPTIGSAFARTTFPPRQLRCDLTDLASTWHFLPLLLLFMNFWDQLMMKELRSIFGLNFAFYFSRSFISSENPACNWWWGIKPRESRSRFGPKVTFLPPFFHVISFQLVRKESMFFLLVLITNSLYLLNVLTGFPLTTVDKFDLNFLSFPSLLYCKPLACWCPIKILKSIDSPFCAW